MKKTIKLSNAPLWLKRFVRSIYRNFFRIRSRIKKFFDKLLKYFKRNEAEQKAGILFDVPRTQYPDKYSIGLYVWFDHDGNAQTTLEYHVERGGDPEVFWAAINNKTIE